MLNDVIKNGYKVLEGSELTKDEALALCSLPPEDIMDLLSLANKVRLKYTDEHHVCSIANVKSGLCREDCRYCAQSAHYSTGVDTFPLLSSEEVFKQAKAAEDSGIKSFGLVTSGKGFKGSDSEFLRIVKLIKDVKKEFPELGICAALGCLDRDAAFALKETGIQHYNHNLQVNPSEYSRIVSTTHSIEERVNTIKYLKEAGVEVCSGGIFGLGESREDRVELAWALKELDVDVIPVNIYVPVKGTPLYETPKLPLAESLRSAAIMRLIHPRKRIKLAAGRETVAQDFQGLFLLSGVNGFLSGGYLTTRGRERAQDIAFLEEIKAFQ